MLDNKLVSVITPAYNCEKTIESTIKSVIGQTYTNWEMFIVDDCSKDKTIEIVEKYTKIDNRIRLIKNDTNRGSADTRNKAIVMANGKYIALLDADDMWYPTKLEKQVEFMNEKKCAFSYTSYQTLREGKTSKDRIFEAKKVINYKKYLANTIIGCLTVMVDREQVKDFQMQKGYLEDVLTWMFYLKKGYLFYGIKDNLAIYRVMEGTKSANKISNSKRYYECLKEQDISFVRRIYSYMGYLYNATKKRVFSRRVVKEKR